PPALPPAALVEPGQGDARSLAHAGGYREQVGPGSVGQAALAPERVETGVVGPAEDRPEPVIVRIRRGRQGHAFLPPVPRLPACPAASRPGKLGPRNGRSLPAISAVAHPALGGQGDDG